VDDYETWLEKKWKFVCCGKESSFFFFTLTEKITDKSVDVPGGYVDVTIRAENN